MGGSPPLPPSPPDAPPSPRLRRQRSFAAVMSSLSFRCCGGCSLCDLDFDTFLCRFPSAAAPKDDPPSPQRLHSGHAWWHDSWRLLGSRRRANPSTAAVSSSAAGWADDADDQFYSKPPRWRIFFRKLRAETRKMNCSKPAPSGFHYDALSYAMNFDDGCWQQGNQGLHPSRFSGPIPMESSSPFNNGTSAS